MARIAVKDIQIPLPLHISELSRNCCRIYKEGSEMGSGERGNTTGARSPSAACTTFNPSLS